MYDACQWEIATISRLRQEGYNITNNTNGGEGTVGLFRCFTPEHRRKLGDIHRGKPITVEQKKLISKTLQGNRNRIGTGKCKVASWKFLMPNPVSLKHRKNVYIGFLRRTLTKEILQAWEKWEGRQLNVPQCI